jgi:hypothetical protein
MFHTSNSIGKRLSYSAEDAKIVAVSYLIYWCISHFQDVHATVLVGIRLAAVRQRLVFLI